MPLHSPGSTQKRRCGSPMTFATQFGLFYVESGASIRTTVSIGVVMRLGSENVDEALRAADVAMYEAKRCGRDRCHFGGARDGPAVAMRTPTDSKRPAPKPLQAA